jgi:hypothetical protein
VVAAAVTVAVVVVVAAAAAARMKLVMVEVVVMEADLTVGCCPCLYCLPQKPTIKHLCSKINGKM